ncbi:MAG: hypothetical protein JOZ68_09445 [Acidimicrobiia bacterium]|nr:hypothetical protein [Acidimicrobiia bacterium]
MRMPPPIAVGSIAVAVFAGGFGVGHFVTDDSGSSSKPHVLGQVFARVPDSTTTPTTTATLAPLTPPSTQPPSPAATPTTAATFASTQATTATQTQTRTTSPPATTNVAFNNPACGTGTATATVDEQTFPKQNNPNSDYETDATTTVHNGVSSPIQVDSLVARLYYEDGGTQDVIFKDAEGSIVQPGATGSSTVAINTGQRIVKTIGMQAFTFHTQGHPECTGH